jgi:hypothetical protein
VKGSGESSVEREGEESSAEKQREENSVEKGSGESLGKKVFYEVGVKGSQGLKEESLAGSAEKCGESSVEKGSEESSSEKQCNESSGEESLGKVLHEAVEGRQDARKRVPPVEMKKRKYIKANIGHQVILRDDGRCTFVDAQGRRCNSQHGIEKDHLVLVAQGGSDEVGNLRILCRQHNAWEAITKLGKETMQGYLKFE